MKSFLELMGRVFLSAIFLYEAYDIIFYMADTRQKMETYGLTWNQDLLLYGTIFLLVIGGLMLLTGYRASLGAILVLLYWVPVTFIVHSWWNDPVAEQRVQAILFMKNLAIAGGVLMVAVNGAGKYAIRRLFATFRVPNT